MRGIQFTYLSNVAGAYSLLIYEAAFILNLLMTKLHFVVYNYVAILVESVTHLQIGGCHDDIQCPAVLLEL